MADNDVQPDYFANHLAQVNQENQVLASNDICNTQGAIIIAKGQPITPDMAKRVAVHKLVTPLENSISLARVYNSKQMYECMLGRLQEIGFAEMVSKLGLLNEIMFHLNKICHYPLISLKLTILAERLPVVFNRVLVCAVISLAIGRELKLKEDILSTVFTATLLSETGLLHINPIIAQEATDFNAEEWRLYQGHVAISKSFADQVPNLPKKVGIAIMEHHERSDGFGYPFKKRGNQLCLEGRILAKVSTISAIYRKRVLQQGYSFSVLIPVLQLNTSGNISQVNNAAVRLLCHLPQPAHQKIDSQRIIKLIPQLLALTKRLNKWVAQTQIIAKEFSEELKNPAMTIHINLYNRLISVLDSSGLLSSHQAHWLASVVKNGKEEDYPVVEQYAVMLYEMEYHCLQVKRSIEPVIPVVFGNNLKFIEMNNDLHKLLT